jgi:anthranilate synthase/aminodeoxychorismate synthase-like glutamine amidotransferase
MIALIDCFDSFTWNIHDYIIRNGGDSHYFRIDQVSVEDLKKMPLKGIVLSPGPGRPSDYPLLFEILESFSNIPILGICLGHQAIGEFFGAKLTKAPYPVHGKITEIQHNGHLLFQKIPEFTEVGRYHSLLIASIDDCPLIPTSFTTEGLIMSIIHKDLPVWGVQFHPESVLTKYGQKMIANWIDNMFR